VSETHYRDLAIQIKPYVNETEAGPLEVAGLFFADRATTRGVPLASSAFVG
jgi:hypothetical protein